MYPSHRAQGCRYVKLLFHQPVILASKVIILFLSLFVAWIDVRALAFDDWRSHWWSRSKCQHCEAILSRVDETMCTVVSDYCTFNIQLPHSIGWASYIQHRWYMQSITFERDTNQSFPVDRPFNSSAFCIVSARGPISISCERTSLAIPSS